MVLGIALTRLAGAGELEELVTCGDGRSTYTLYLPDGWDPGQRWPLLLVMDPRGRSVPAAERFFEAADTHGWVVASSDDTRSDGVGDDPNGGAIAAILADVVDRAAIAEDEVALAGFSGTARFAWDVGRTAPEVVFAVLAAGGATPDGAMPTETVPFAWFGVAGSRDFNYREARGADAVLEALGAVHRFEGFDGTHEWPPTELAGRMLAWAEVQGQLSGRRPRDERRLDLALAAERAHLATLDDVWERWWIAEAVSRTHAGGRDVTPEAREAAALAESRTFRARRRFDENLAAREEDYALRLSAVAAGIRDPGQAPPATAEAAFRLGIAGLLRAAERDDPRGDAAGRTLASYAAVLGSTIPRTVGAPRRAAASLAIAALVRPDDPTVHYNLGCAWALAGEENEALDALERAVTLGFADGAYMVADPDLASLRAEPRFTALVARAWFLQRCDPYRGVAPANQDAGCR